MKSVKRITCTAHLLGVMLIIVGCTDNGTGPPAAKTATTAKAATKLLDLSERPKLKATVSTVITYRDKAGNVHQKKFSQKIKAEFDSRGLARAILDVGVASDGGTAVFASMTDGVAGFAQYTTDPTVLTPVVAVASGSLTYNYAESFTDSVGSVFEVYGWAPSEGTPFTDGWAYRNGVLISRYHADWTPASGGYTLADQTLASYQPDGLVAGTVVSTVTGGGGGTCIICGVEPMSESLGAKLGSHLRLALDKVGCWLAPQVAYAMIMDCTREEMDFGIHTYLLGEATYSGMAFWGTGWYFTGWGMWTRSLYSMLACIDGQWDRRGARGPGACQTNPRLCTGGGGGSW